MTWRDHAACTGRPELFVDDTHLYEAQQICASCPVICDCRVARKQLEQTTRSAHPGVWAGDYWAVRTTASRKAKLVT